MYSEGVKFLQHQVSREDLSTSLEKISDLVGAYPHLQPLLGNELTEVSELWSKILSVELQPPSGNRPREDVCSDLDLIELL